MLYQFNDIVLKGMPFNTNWYEKVATSIGL